MQPCDVRLLTRSGFRIRKLVANVEQTAMDLLSELKLKKHIVPPPRLERHRYDDSDEYDDDEDEERYYDDYDYDRENRWDEEDGDDDDEDDNPLFDLLMRRFR